MNGKVKHSKNVRLKKPKPNLHGPNSPTPKKTILNRTKQEENKTQEKKFEQTDV